jgi:Putative phage tail protein
MSGLLGGGKAKASQAPQAVGSMRVQQSSYGAVIPLCYGTNRLSANMIWYDGFTAYPHQQNTGGKGGVTGGGGGKGSGGTTTYTYSSSFIMGLCEGVISGIGKVWQTKNLTTMAALGGATFVGGQAQAAWGYLTTNFAAKALGYSNLAYAAFANYDLGGAAETPNITFELSGIGSGGAGGKDAIASSVVLDLLVRTGFPTSYMDMSLTSYANYTIANGFFISPFLLQQKAAAEWLKEISDTTNSEWIWAGGLLTLIPYGDVAVTGNGVTYTPSLSPIYALSDDDFEVTSDDEEPVTISRIDQSDSYNQIPIEFLDATNSYNPAVYTAEDAGHIDLFGVRTANTIQAHHITNKTTAQNVANLMLWRGLYIRKIYKWKMGWKHILLDPMDLVSLTDSNLGLNNELVRITEINESENGLLDFTAEEMTGDIASVPLYPDSIITRYEADYNKSAPSVNMPIIFEAPILLTQSPIVDVYIALSGSTSLWGGCNIWVSNDGVTYKFLQRMVGGARQGILRDALPNSTNTIDQTNILKVDMSMSRGAIANSSTVLDATTNNTLCYVDGELISFGANVLVATNQYNFSYLNRGAYGTSKSSHGSGTQFARIDDAIIQLPIDQTRIGQTIYLKFQSFNIYSGGLQDITTCADYPFFVTGNSLKAPLANPTNVTSNFIGGLTKILWTGIGDVRTPIDYEIRKGDTFANSQKIGRTTDTGFNATGDGKYWITAHYQTPTGVDVYSSVPPSIVLAGAVLTKNVIQTWDEYSTNFIGTATLGAFKIGGQNNWLNSTNILAETNLLYGKGSIIELIGQNNWLNSTNILAEQNILWGGGIYPTGYYEIPTSHIVNLSAPAVCQIGINWNVKGQSIYDNFLAIQNVLNASDILGTAFNALVNGTPQIALSQDGVTYAPWQNYSAGFYQFKSVKVRIFLESYNSQTIAILNQFSFFVDVPDRIDNGTNVSILAAGSSIVYSNASGARPFNASPNVQITILNAVAGDDVVLSAQTASGFTVRVLNGGVGVVRTINWVAQGY